MLTFLWGVVAADRTVEMLQWPLPFIYICYFDAHWVLQKVQPWSEFLPYWSDDPKQKRTNLPAEQAPGGKNKRIKKTLLLHHSAYFVNVCSITKSHHSVLFWKLFIQNINRVGVLRDFMRNWGQKWNLVFFFTFVIHVCFY